jgi:hypothetical protein
MFHIWELYLFLLREGHSEKDTSGILGETS